jgi:hypothetical protein
MPLVSIMINFSFHRIEVSRKAPILLMLLSVNLCRAEQLRTHRQSGPLGGIDIDFEAQAILFFEEIDDAAHLGEALDLSDGQYVAFPGNAQKLLNQGFVLAGDIEDVAGVEATLL